MEKPKTTNVKPQGAAAATPAAPAPQTTPPSAAHGKVPPLFRPIDWLALLVTFVFVAVGYYLTIAPALTLEDSGELAVGAYYAGIPHPPGYPVWTIYSYFWSIIPIGNVAWRVALGSAFAGAFASGLLALVVSRGSSMIIESIDDLKNIDRRWENITCLVAGFVAGTLIGFNGYMWSQATIVEVYTLSVVSLMGVVVCLMRWLYAPHQHRYLYWAFFLYGICFNNHQSLLVIAMAMQVLVWRAEPRLGREMFFWNTLIWFVVGFIVQPGVLKSNLPVQVIFHLIGVGSAILWVILLIQTRKKTVEFAVDGAMLLSLAGLGGLFLGITNHVPRIGENGVLLVFTTIVGLGALGVLIHLVRKTKSSYREWWVTLLSGFSWLAGAAFYLFMPIAGATNPPMQWGYPRTLNGFIHALTRGQYEKIHPTSGTGETLPEIIASFFQTYGMQLWRFLEGLNDEFNFFYLLIALVIFLYYRKLKARERAWIIGMIAMFICLGPFLVLLLNFSSDRQSLDLVRVFLTSAHVFVSMSVGFGLSLLATSMLAHFDSLRRVSILGGICAVDFAFFLLAINAQYDFDPDQAARYGFFKILCWLLAVTCVILFWKHGSQQDPLLKFGLPGLFVLASLGLTVVAFFGDPIGFENLGKVFSAIGNAFQPHQYGLPIFAALLLLAGAGVFLVFVLMARNKPPIALTLLLFALMPSYSIMTHWFPNEQRGHYFGFWFGHDMFTPPFTASDGKLSYDAREREKAMAGPKGELVYPEMDRDAILFGGTDPGRFCPTYMIFCDSFLDPEDRVDQNPVFDRRDVYIITQNALADNTYLEYIRAHYYRSDQIKYDTPFFQEALRGSKEREEDYRTNIIAQLAYNLLDRPVTAWGTKVEKRRREQGVYPPKEIYTPTPEDSQRCFSEYIHDAQRRVMHDRQFPKEPPQLRPGEDVKLDPVSGRVQVSGQVAVMAINGLLTKVIFDKNPTNEFYVEESFPLEWMFPHLTPFGVIMKINRQPVPELSEVVLQRDHEFWAKYSERLIGNWITYDTKVEDIAKWVEKVYLRKDFSEYTGDLKFVRDDQAQKAFSKLRSSIAGIYAWRLGMSANTPTPPQYIVQGAARERMIKEADFAFRQAFAYCPYSPEAVYRYVQLLANLNRIDDAIIVAETCRKLDPYNGAIADLVQRLHATKIEFGKMQQQNADIMSQVTQLEQQVRQNPDDFQKAFDLASKYAQIRQNDRAGRVLENIVNHPKADRSAVLVAAQAYVQMTDYQRLEKALEKLVTLEPEQPEAWYDLAGVRSHIGKPQEALQALRQSFELSAKRLARDPKASNLRSNAVNDGRFQNIRNLDEFKALVAPR